MEYSIKKSITKWSSLSGIGNSKLIRSFNIWFVVIPLAAKALESMEGSIGLGFFEPPLLISMTLPFSLKALYLATLFFTAANIFYMIFCPQIIKSYNSYSDFNEKEGSFEALKQMYESLLEKSNAEYTNTLISDFLGHVKIHGYNKNDSSLTERQKFDLCKLDEGQLPEAFSNIKGAFDIESRRMQAWVSLLYLCGFLCLGYLLYENIIYVFDIKL